MKKSLQTIFLNFLIVSLINNLCYAEDVIRLEKDKPAPFTGYLFTDSKTKEIRIQLLEREAYKELNESLEKTNSLYKQNTEMKDQQIKIITEQNTNLAKNLREERSTSNWERFMWFGLGVLATGAALHGLKEIAR